MRLFVATLMLLTCAAGTALAGRTITYDNRTTFLNLLSPPPLPAAFHGCALNGDNSFSLGAEATLTIDGIQFDNMYGETNKPVAARPINQSAEITSFLLFGTGLALIGLAQKLIRG